MAALSAAVSLAISLVWEISAWVRSVLAWYSAVSEICSTAPIAGSTESSDLSMMTADLTMVLANADDTMPIASKILTELCVVFIGDAS